MKRIFASFLLFLLAVAARAVGPADLGRLSQGESVGHYSVRALYLDPAGAPKGARFLHERGMPVDVLFFDSVPQLSLYFRTPVSTDKGEPHTLEHLVLGKGGAGRKLNTMMPMRMGEHTAGTYSEMTKYQMSSAAGPSEFYELLGTFLDALIRPDFTDEEARREVAHFAVAGSSAAPSLQEKGTVYNEMVSRLENPDYRLWRGLVKTLYGPKHPMARESGGDPDLLWDLTPAEIRAFHAEHYRLDANAAFIAALPASWSAEDFLERLDAMIRRLEPEASGRPAETLPPPAPAEPGAVWIGRFPSEDASSPRLALLPWPIVETFSWEEEIRLQLALSILANGESAYLYKDLIDQKTRTFDSGATGVGAYVETLPHSYARAYLTGLPAASATPDMLGRLRSLIMERVRWLHDLPPGAGELAEAAEMARALIRSSRRSTLKAMDGPPDFGKRHSGREWHLFLEQLASEPGFKKPLSADAIYDKILGEMAEGANPWAAVIERAGLLGEPYIISVRADPGMLESQREARRARLEAETARLARLHDLPAPEALARYKGDYDAATALLDRLRAEAARPAFLKAPPLTLDDIDWTQGRLPSGPRLLRTHFGSTPFTDIRVSFDLGGLSPEDLEVLPLLENALAGVGVLTAEGKTLDYAEVERRLRAEVYGAGASASADPIGGRAFLSFYAGASNPGEIDRAADWIETFMRRSALGPDSRKRLIDLLRSEIQSLRGIFQEDEESWIRRAAQAYEYQDQPVYMTLHSPFTLLRRLNRLRWRLAEPGDPETEGLEAAVESLSGAARRGDRAGVEAVLKTLPRALGEYLGWELSHLPVSSWSADFSELCADLKADFGRSEETIARLEKLARSVLVRARAKVHLNGRAANADRAAAAVDRVLAGLPEGDSPGESPRRSVVRDRLRKRVPGLERPVHAGLVNPGGKTAAFAVRTPLSGYLGWDEDDLVDALAAGTLAGGGAHALFMRTWSEGLAYSNGMSFSKQSGMLDYYADRSPDPAQTLRFVSGVAESFALDDPFYLEYSLSGTFGDYRAADGFSSRGAALALDIERGITPAAVRKYKSAMLKLARAPGTLDRVRGRLRPVFGRVLIGFPGERVAGAAGASAFIVAPEEILKTYEAFLKETGETESLVRLYPRDFWP